MSLKYYDKAQIYITRCVHPSFNHLAYIGLDTKCDPNYLGSSVTLKWWINYLGREHFSKEILETVSGNMVEVCKREQFYIDSHNAVVNPNYFNMNGSKTYDVEDFAVGLDFWVKPETESAKRFLSQLSAQTHKLTAASLRALKNAVSVMVYGALKYEQTEFEYVEGKIYPYCSHCEDFSEALSALHNLGVVNHGTFSVKLRQEFIDNLPEDIWHNHFKVKSI